MIFGSGVLVGCDTSISDRNIRFMPGERVQVLWARQQKTDGTAIFVDPRSGKKFASGHIAGAQNIKLPQVPKGAPIDPTIGRYDNIIVYGLNPGDVAARAMTKRLLTNKYGGVWLYSGGLQEWQQQGGEVEVSELETQEQSR
ncbi:MAG: rhodanese-like domain-containing protein [Phycisphaeraceae bacterium]|nr:rhodanese-like domain-containing protein [Phycisphaerales bacterium]MCB9861138.1 rhodanese-like domain-containing protein [Phycisphaeraceae bacterium]